MQELIAVNPSIVSGQEIPTATDMDLLWKNLRDTKMQAIGAYALALEYISRDNSEDSRETFKLVEEARAVVERAGVSLPHLEWAVCFYAANTCRLGDTESKIVQWLFENLDSLLPGAVRIQKKSDGFNIPDGFVSIDGDIYPVEVKKSDFDKNALSQIKRYMHTYKSKGGIAVARKLKCSLPSNITFIKAPPYKDM